jgi:energy-coupling factor transport system substrate-specific component
MPLWLAPAVYAIVSACHGFLYGVLYAPALLFGMSFDGMLAWIVAGLPFDLIHGISNLVCGVMIVPFATLLTRLKKQYRF